MNRWARVTIQERGMIYNDHGVWINESNVTSMIDLDDGCMICFATSEDDAIKVKQSIDDIFSDWDNWQQIHKDS
tara:strand:+ start:183 stop:404 length:222 start_codon:yes stop_codon:yes gene_type:complete